MQEQQPILVEIEGLGELEFPAGTDQAVIQQTVKRMISGQEAPQPSGAFSLSDEEWGAMPAGQKMRNVLTVAGNLMGGGLFGQGGVEAVENPKTALATAAIPVAGRMLPKVVEPMRRVAGISKVRAGQNMQEVAHAAQNIPVQTGRIGPTIARAQELQGTGSRMPRVVTQLSRRVADRPDGALNFREGSDFASSMSRMSVNERNTLNPQMHRQVGEISRALRNELTDAAEQVGRGAQYSRGVREYARASAVDEFAEKAKKNLLKALLGAGPAAGIGAGVYHLLGGKGGGR
jgi:hypothetical protein